MVSNKALREITVSLPDDLLNYADQRAKELNTSRSEVISDALSTIRASEDDRRAAEGYQYFAAEASDFANATARMVAESWDEDFSPNMIL
jgi:metal-responsive CopG/Arc/MetJ family transcriptional regulator